MVEHGRVVLHGVTIGPVRLSLKDRTLAHHPTKYRWLGGDANGNVQTVERRWVGWRLSLIHI